MKKLGRAAANIAISLLGILATLLLLEIGLRLIAPGRVVIGFGPLWAPDPVLGWRLEPDSHVRVWSAHTMLDVSTNSHGWRDVEHALPKPEGVFRILVLGDSFMEGHAVSDDDIFARQLETVARQAGLDNVDVMNMSVEGYGTLQSYLAYVEEGMSYDPDLVLLGFFAGNDVHDNYRPLQAALWGESAYVVIGRPYLESSDQGSWVIAEPDYEKVLVLDSQREQWSRWQRSRVLSVLGRAFVNYLEAQEESEGTGQDKNIWIGANFCQETPQFTEGWAVTERILVKLDSTVREAGAHLIVFTVPSREEADLDYLQEVKDTFENPDTICLEEGVADERILSILEANDIPGVDLLPVFRTALNENGQDVFARDNHWNAEGYALAADEVFDALSAEGFLPDH